MYSIISSVLFQNFLIMNILIQILYFMVEILIEFLIIMFVYELISYLQYNFSKKSKKSFSIKEIFNESWIIFFIIALVIVSVNHIF